MTRIGFWGMNNIGNCSDRFQLPGPTAEMLSVIK